ncbi:MAG: endolytic transglycosylase MltG [Deltaproteobacteria bacterium]|nr:endolytic transglycosylase MltG [Deltaproteobacteria bacterium]
MRRAVVVLVLLLVLVVGAAGGFYAYIDFEAISPYDPKATEKLELEVPRGATHAQIGRMLLEQRLISSLFVWRAYLRLHPGFDPKAGRHNVARSMSMVMIQKALSEPPLPEDLPVTIVEGWRLIDADASLARDGWISPGQYVAAASKVEDFKIPFQTHSLEGYLLPETYLVNRRKPLDPKKLIQRQLDAFVERFQRPYADELQKTGRSLSDVVIMASMLEREEPTPALRPKVAGLLYKRIASKWALGVDATSRYTLDDWNDRKAFLEKLRDPADPYNTRLHKGMPPTAIGAPSLDSLMAALRPEPNDAWYYLHDANKQIHFSKTAEEHDRRRKELDVW